MDKIAKKVLDESFSTAFQRCSKDFVESSSSLLFTFLLALILIYLTLAAQFESFRDPLIIMFTVPLAIAGAVISLWYFNQTLNIFSQIGQIMLIGLVTKNGILIVEFANQKKAQGLSVVDQEKHVTSAPNLMTSINNLDTANLALVQVQAGLQWESINWRINILNGFNSLCYSCYLYYLSRKNQIYY
jgi:multidrug efflux pump